MTHRSNSAGIEPLVSRLAHFEAVTKALNLFVGRGRRYSNVECERGSGVPARMLECYRQQPFTDHWRPIKEEEFASLIVFLGADFTSTYLDKISAAQAAIDLPDEGDPDPMSVAIGATEDAAEIVRRAADGEFCGKDRQALKAVGRRKITRGMQLVAAAKAA